MVLKFLPVIFCDNSQAICKVSVLTVLTYWIKLALKRQRKNRRLKDSGFLSGFFLRFVFFFAEKIELRCTAGV